MPHKRYNGKLTGVIVKIGREDWIKIFAGLAILSFVAAFIQGWVQLQLQYFAIMVGITVLLFALWHKKESRTMDVKQAYERSLPLLNYFKVSSESGARLQWASRHTDNKRFSTSGKVWDLQFRGNPSKAVVQLDAKSGKVVNLILDTEERQAPIHLGWGEETTPRYRYPYPKMKREVKEEVKPS